MLFVKDLYIPGLLPWISEPSSGSVGKELAGGVFPAFLFMFGMTIPFAISEKINENLSSYDIIRHIFSRTIILLVIGILMVNTTRVNPELTGFGKNIWSLLMFIAVFLAWNRYHEKENNFFTIIGLRFLGLAALVFIVFKFRSGTFENGGSLITGWWEIPGLAGWGLLVSALTFLALRNSIFGTLLIWLVFLGLNILSQLMLLEFLNPVRPYLGVILDGYFPVIFLSGHLAGLVLKKFSSTEYRKVFLSLLFMSLLMIVTGYSLREWIFTTGVSGNPGIALVCCGLTLIIFILIYWVADVRKNDRWFNFLKPAGENSFTTYIAPNIIYYLLLISGLPVFFYHNSANIFLNVLGSALWAIIMVFLISVLVRLNIKLKI
jgi:hypothetical protein